MAESEVAVAQGRGRKVGATGAYGTGLEFLRKLRQKPALQVAERNKRKTSLQTADS